MKRLTEKKEKDKKETEAPRIEIKKRKYVAQCCAKQSKIISGCHD